MPSLPAAVWGSTDGISVRTPSAHRHCRSSVRDLSIHRTPRQCSRFSNVLIVAGVDWYRYHFRVERYASSPGDRNGLCRAFANAPPAGRSRLRCAYANSPARSWIYRRFGHVPPWRKWPVQLIVEMRCRGVNVIKVTANKIRIRSLGRPDDISTAALRRPLYAIPGTAAHGGDIYCSRRRQPRIIGLTTPRRREFPTAIRRS